MTPGERVNRVSLALQGTMAALVAFFAEQLGGDQFAHLVLVVACDSHVQYIANRDDRAVSTRMLRDLLGRWAVGLPDTLPENISSAGAAFEYLLREFEANAAKAAAGDTDALDQQQSRRAELVGYVAQLLGELNRFKAAQQ